MIASGGLMLAGTKRRSPTWQLSLLLVIFGGVVGYSCFENLDIWGNGRQHQALYGIGFFAGIVAFISGIVSFLAIAVKAVASPTGSGSAIAARSPAMPRQPRPKAVVDRQASIPSSAAATLSWLRITLAAVVALACIVVLRDWGRPPLTSSYGRAYWLSAVLTLLLSQLPHAVALVRTWKVPDRTGLALAIAAGATQVLGTFFADLRYHALRLDPWPWLSGSLGFAVVLLASLAWRPFFSRKGDVGLLISIFFGFVAYIALAQIGLAIFARMHLL
jgi:hypothetical protein